MHINRTRLVRLREDKGWSQADLALAAGLSRPYVSQIENNVRDPSPIVVQALARALDVDSVVLTTAWTCPFCGNVIAELSTSTRGSKVPNRRIEI